MVSATSELLILCLDLVKTRVVVLGVEMRKLFIGSILVGLIEKTQDVKIMKAIAKVCVNLQSFSPCLKTDLIVDAGRMDAKQERENALASPQFKGEIHSLGKNDAVRRKTFPRRCRIKRTIS